MHEYKNDIKAMNSLVLPMLITQVLQLLFQIGDQAIVGRLSIDEFVAVGISASFLFLITGTIGMLGVVFNIQGGKYLGQQDVTLFGKSFNTSMTLAIFIGILSELLILIFGSFMLKNMYGLDKDILRYATSYLYIGGLGIGIITISFIFSAYFKNIRNTKILLFSYIAASIINVTLDYILVFGKWGAPQLGVTGAAIGSIVGYLVSIFICMLAFKKSNKFTFVFSLDVGILKSITKLYIPLFLQDLVESTLFAMVLSMIVARLAVTYLATYNVLLALIEFIMLPAYGYSSSCMTLTSQAYGHQNKVGRYPSIALIMLFSLTIPISVFLITLSDPLSSIITNKKDVIEKVNQFILLATVITLFNGIQMVLRSTLQSIDLERWVLMYSTLIYIASIPLIFFLSQSYQLQGIFIGLGICYAALGFGFLFKMNTKSII